MAKPRVTLIRGGVRELLNDPGVRAHMEALAERVAAAARATAPVRTGAYRDSIEAGSDTTDRAVGRVYADVDYAALLESRTGNLARALDAARGG